MRTAVMVQMAKLAKTATGPVGLAAKASISKSPLGEFIDTKVLVEAIKKAGLKMTSDSAVERHKANLSLKRAGMKKTASALFHEIELGGKVGHWVRIFDNDGLEVAMGRSENEDDALLHAIVGALREGR